MAAHHKDLSDTYSRSMQYHGMGVALFEPQCFEDMTPPCCGFFDQNHDFNLITNITHLPSEYYPLRTSPRKMQDMGIVWQPKTSYGVTAQMFDASGSSPPGLVAGAAAHIKYSSDRKFGAILMTTNPVTLVAYNQKHLFMQWLEDNKVLLHERYGPELRKFGMWIVTRTHAAPHASINVWCDDNTDAVVSMKAKAAMLGELGEDVSWKDHASDKDWSHYAAKTSNGIVVFMDGIHIKPWHWYLEAVKQSMPWADANPRPRRVPMPSPYAPFPEQAPQPAPATEPSQYHRDDVDEFDEQMLKDIGAYSQLSRSSRGSLRLPSGRQSMHVHGTLPEQYKSA